MKNSLPILNLAGALLPVRPMKDVVTDCEYHRALDQHTPALRRLDPS